MMKKIVLLSALAVFFIACQNKSEYTISGSLTDNTYEGQKVYLEQWTDSIMVTVDSANIVDGAFTFKGVTETPVLRFITLGNMRNKARSMVMVEPGKIDITYDSLFHISGSAINDKFTVFNLKQKDLTTKIRSLSDQYNSAMVDGIMSDTLDAELTSAYEKVANEAQTLSYDFIK